MSPRLEHAGVRRLRMAYPTPTALYQAGGEQIHTTGAETSPRMAHKIAVAVETALAAQTVTLPGQAALGRVIAELTGELDRLADRRQALAEIEEVFTAHPFGELLATLPGIAPRTGARILAEIGDPNRFASGAKLASYAGLAPVTRQSGSTLNHSARSRRGNHRLKNAMFLAAFASLKSPESRAFYDRKRAEGKHHNAAVMCWHAAAATSSSPCSTTAPPTSHQAPPRTRRGRLTVALTSP